MSFITLSGVNVDDFSGWELRWRIYTTKRTFPTIRRIELVGKKKFAATALDLKYETYIVYVASLSSTSLITSLNSILLDANVHLSYRSQIFGLIAEKAFTKVPNKYVDFIDIFSPNLASKLPKHTGINDHAIEPVDS